MYVQCVVFAYGRRFGIRYDTLVSMELVEEVNSLITLQKSSYEMKKVEGYNDISGQQPVTNLQQLRGMSSVEDNSRLWRSY